MCYKLKSLELDKRINSYIGVIQENSIEILLQTSLPYMLLLIVCASYCAPYSKRPYVEHEANMWCSYYMTLFGSRTFYFFLSSPVINVVTILSDCD